MMFDPSWLRPTTSWNAKLARASEHVESLRALVRQYRESGPYEVRPEATDTPGRLAYRLSVWRPQPISISTTVGDIVHNLRGALESLAFELALRSQGGTLTDSQGQASTFPICETPEKFDSFFTGKRADLFDGSARAVLRDAQPFKRHEEAVAVGAVEAIEILGAKAGGFKEDFTQSLLHRLNALWNIDKHRRLVPTEWLPRDYWWSSNGPTNRRMEHGDRDIRDGAVLFYMVGSDEGMENKVYHQFNLVLKDDPAFNASQDWSVDVVALMEQFLSHVEMIIRKTAYLFGNG
ncbi:hypothetical protein [Amycolatopsis sp. lyj-112]|uniref:hypothetical protein n=1 Tax=Amycolatopsis sp. lyj-112 TaxID=2789288 RepID=UPI00397A71E9